MGMISHKSNATEGDKVCSAPLAWPGLALHALLLNAESHDLDLAGF